MKRSIVFLFYLISVCAFSQSYSPSGSLNVARWNHQSQVLYNKKVLVFGGDQGYLIPAMVNNSAELYEPGSGTWSYTGSMNKKRTNFSSVVLPNGNILAIGGTMNWDGSETYSTASCEIYNVAIGTWTYTDSMKVQRENHKAILLKTGKVLVVGDKDGRCELYDPSINKWENTGSNVAYVGGGMDLIMLQDGKVLVTLEKSAQLYDPASGTWSLLSNLVGDRLFHSSILLPDGRVLIAGSTRFTDQNSAEIFDPVQNTFTATGSMSEYRASSPMILMDDGRVLIYGIGDPFNAGNTKTIEIYNPSSGIWTSNIYNQIGAQGYTIHKLTDGKILVVGGSFTTLNGATKGCVLINQNISGCVMPDLSVQVSGGNTCVGNPSTVTLANSQAGVTYKLFLGTTELSTASGNGANLIFTIPASGINSGSNVYSIRTAKTGCVSYMLQDTAIVIARFSVSKPAITPVGSSSICEGDSVLLTAPAGYSQYIWTNNKTTQTIYAKSEGDYSVSVMEANGCVSMFSNSSRINVNPLLPTSVIIAADANPLDSGTVVTFTASPTNPGNSPVYQWKVNGEDVGTNSLQYASKELLTSDEIICIMTSSAVCPTSVISTSNSIRMIVNAVIHRPKIVSVNPVMNSISAPSNANIDISFSQSMNTAISSKMHVFGEYTGKIHGNYLVSGSAGVVFNPELNFKPGEKLTVIVDSSAKNINDISISQGYVHEFKVAPSPSFGIFKQGTNVENITSAYQMRIADFNMDGILDIVVSEPNYYKLKIFFGKGDGTFYRGPEIADVRSGQDLTIADFNNDGASDLLAFSSNQPVNVLMNNGIGGFSNNAIDVSTSKVKASTGDYDGDGDIDFAIASTYPTPHIDIRWNDGLGNFSENSSINLPGPPLTLYSGDLDNDGDLDMVSSYNTALVILRNDGKGNFVQEPIVYQSIQFVLPQGIEDYNGDGYLDILAVTYYTSTSKRTFNILYNLGNGIFSDISNILSPEEGSPSINSNDFDGDGDLDLGIINYGNGSTSDSVRIWKNNGLGVFSFSNSLKLGNNTYSRSITSGDIDGDGDMDIAVTNNNTNYVSILLNDGTRPSINISGSIEKEICAGSTFSVPFIKSGTFNSGNIFTLQLSDANGSFSNPVTLGTYTGSTSAIIKGLIPASLSASHDYKIRVIGSSPSVISADNGRKILIKTGCPFISSVLPVAGDISASTEKVRIAFSQEMLASTASASVIGIQGNIAGNYALPSRGSFKHHLDTVSFIPMPEFAAGEKISVTIDTNARSISGQRLSKPYVYSFLTRAAPSPAFFTPVKPKLEVVSEYVLCAGDFNNDGAADIVTKTSSAIIVYKNNGRGVFTKLEELDLSVFLFNGCNSADFDNDGDRDLVISIYDPQLKVNKLQIILNDGNGHFTFEKSFITTSAVRNFQIEDVNGDRLPDIVCIEPVLFKTSIYLNQGGINFAATYLEINTFAVDFALADFDMDGDIDISTINQDPRGTHESISIIFNDGAGRFFGKKDLDIEISNLSKILASDFNGDHISDIAFYSSSPTTVFVWINDGSGNFPISKSMSHSKHTEFLTSADLDGDQDLDLIFAYWGGVFSISKNDGDGNFSDPEVVNSGEELDGSPIGMVVADFDSDGDIDIVNSSSLYITCFINDLSISTGSVSSAFCKGDIIKVPFTFRGIPEGSNFSVEMSDASGDFTNSIEIGTGKSPYIFCTIPSSVSTGSEFRVRVKCDSLNLVGSDNGLNLTVTSGCPVLDTLLPYPNEYGVNAASSIIAVYSAPLESATINSTNIKVFGNSSGLISGSGVFSVQGTDSLIYDPANIFFAGETVSVTIKKEVKGTEDKPLEKPFVYDFKVGAAPSTGNFETKEITYTPNIGIYDMTHGDLDKDGDLDVVLIENTTSQIVVRYNNDGLFESYAYFATGEFPVVIKLADLDGDSDLDIVTANTSGDHLSVLKNDGSGSFSLPTTIKVAYVPRDLCIADFDGDGDLDIASVSYYYGISLIKNDGAGNFTHEKVLPIKNNFSICAVEIDSDGDMDLVVSTSTGIAIFLNDGDADFRFFKYSNADLEFRKIYPADFNLDGKMDFAATNTNSSDIISILINQGNYQFSKLNIPIYATIYDVSLADIDGDKDIDLLVGIQNNIININNDGNGAFPYINRTSIAGPPEAMTVFDLDGDNDLDIATANAISPRRFTTLINGTYVSITNSTALKFCVGNPVAIEYKTNTVFNSGNFVEVQLSDRNGSFDFPVSLSNTVTNFSTGIINTFIPDTITPGANYKVRLVTSTPEMIGTATKVAVNIPPVIHAGADQEVCAGTYVTLNASGIYSYTWDNGVFNGVPFIATSSKTYTVRGTDSNGCSGTSKLVLTVHPLPKVTAGEDQIICYGQQVTLTATGANTLSWDKGVINGTPFTPLNSEKFTVVGTDEHNCSATDHVYITIDACTGLDGQDNVTNALVKVYPNPVSDVLNIDTKNIPDMLVLYNMQGVEAVREMKSTKIDTKGLEQGVYILKIVSGDVTLIKKVTIQH